MIRVLVIIAVTGFLVSIVSLSAAVGIVGPEAIARGAWSWRPGYGWNFNHEDDGGWGVRVHEAGRHGDDGRQTTRWIAWSGGDTLDVELPANIQYTQAAGPAKLSVTGPSDAVADVELDGGRLRFNHDRDRDADLTIVMSAPSVTHFQLGGSGRLAVANYHQDKLIVDLPGDADFIAKGEAKRVELSISGSANADLGAVKTQAAAVNIQGSGDAKLAPTQMARIDISGSGDVTLLTHPPKLESHVSGSGDIVQADGEP